MPATRARLGVILLTVFIDLVGFGLVLPVLPYYAQRLGAAGLGYGALIGAFSLMQFVASVALGRWSDHVGRRRVLLTSIVLGAGGYLLFAFAKSYTLLLIARMVSGFAAGNLSVAQAYIADVTAPAERSRGMALMGAALGLGFIVGPALGGVAGHFGGARGVGMVGATLCLVNYVSAFSILGESLAVERRARRRLLDLRHLRRGFADPALRAALIAFGVIPFAFSGYWVALPLHAQASFGWGERELGWFFAVIGVVAALVQGYVFGRIARRVADRWLAITGTFGMALPIAVTPLLPVSAALYASVIALAFANSIAAPALTALVSTLSDPAEQGAMLGAAQSLGALGRFSGPFVFGVAYDRLGAGAAFLAAGSVMLLTGVATLPLRPTQATLTTPSAPEAT